MFDHNFPSSEYFYQSSWTRSSVAKREIVLVSDWQESSQLTCAWAFLLQSITVSRPTRSITSRMRSCFSSSRGCISAFFDEDVEDIDDFFFQVFDDSVSTMSWIVSPTLRKSFALPIYNNQPSHTEENFLLISPSPSVLPRWCTEWLQTVGNLRRVHLFRTLSLRTFCV